MTLHVVKDVDERRYGVRWQPWAGKWAVSTRSRPQETYHETLPEAMAAFYGRSGGEVREARGRKRT
jgi:hypothetical protein